MKLNDDGNFMTQDGIILSVGSLLPEEQAQTAIRFSQTIAKREHVEYTLNQTTSPPYTRLYECVIPKKNFSKAFDKLNRLMHDFEPFDFTWMETEDTDKLVIVWGEDHELLKMVQTSIIDILNPLREGYFKQKYLNDSYYLDPTEHASLKEFGWPYVSHYNPYLIIAKAKESFTSLKNLEFEWPFHRGMITDIFLGIKEKPGTFAEMHEIKFDIKKPKPKAKTDPSGMLK